MPSAASVPNAVMHAQPMEDYPFPLANGQVAILRLPIKLERDDVERLVRYISLLVPPDDEVKP